MAAGAPVPPLDFLKLTRMPLQILYGDNIPTAPIPDLVADGRRAQIVAAKLFEQAIDSRGGDMELLLTPDAGLRGNSHFMYSDLNNLQIADLLSQYLHRKGLDKRSENHNDER
jgi:hypothetical protein